jgi:hypothetical protein
MYEDISLFARDFINLPSFRTRRRKLRIREAYQKLVGEEIKISCSTCYVEALLKLLKIIKMATPNYELKRGVVLQAFGDASRTYTNDTITDEAGDWFMRNEPAKMILFSRHPEQPLNSEVEEVKNEVILDEIPDPMKVAAEVSGLNAKQQALKDLNDSINDKVVTDVNDPPIPEEVKEKKKVVRKAVKKAK